MATGRVPTTANSPLTAKGDLFGYSTTQARVPVGSDGETLVADSSTSTGLRYNPQNALANPIINGGFDIWQRGTTFSTPASPFYTADRWQAARQGAASGITISRQATGDTTNLPNIQYCVRVQRDSGNTNTSDLIIGQSLETTNSIPFAGKTVTFSFYARKGALFSATSNLLTVVLTSGTGTDQNNAFTGNFTNATNIILQNVTLTNDWQRFALTATVGATATQLAPRFVSTTSGTAGATDYFEVTGVQIDLGTYTASTAPTFRRSGGTLAGEYLACARYYFRSANTSAYAWHGLGFARTTTAIDIPVVLPVPMRVAPTSLDVSNLEFGNGTDAIAATALTIAQSTNQIVTVTNAVTGATQFRPYALRNANTTAGYFGVTAEL